MQDLAVNLGIDVLFKGTNFIRLLGGLWTALWISLVSVAISIPLGIGMGVLMTKKNRILKEYKLKAALKNPDEFNTRMISLSGVAFLAV